MLVIIVAAALLILLFARVAYGLIKWDIRFDIRIIELGFHCFVAGMLTALILMIAFGWIIL